MRGLMLQVGFDYENGGYSAPLFPDGTFVYLPIPERRPVRGGPSYPDHGRTVGRDVTRYLPTDVVSVGPERMAGRPSRELVPVGDARPHVDPEFSTFTYGEQSNISRGRKLATLREGDHVFFFESFVEATEDESVGRTFAEIRASQRRRDKVYGVIGYFELEAVHDFDGIMGDPVVRRRVRMNAHMRRDPLERSLLVATGTGRSRMLGRTRPVSVIGRKRNGAKNYIFSREFSELSGLTGQVYRAVNTIKGSRRVEAVLEWLGG